MSTVAVPEEALSTASPETSEQTQNVSVNESSEKSNQPTVDSKMNENTTKTTTSSEPQPTDNTSTTQTTLSDPFSAIGSMWSGWKSQFDSNETTTRDTQNATTGTDQLANATAAAQAAANDWFQGAGHMWESAVQGVGDRIKTASTAVDTTALGEQVNVLRQKSGQFVEDVSNSVKSLQLGIDGEQISKRAEEISSSTKGLLEHASQAVQRSHKEALEIFVDSDTLPTTNQSDSKLSCAPWDQTALPESEKSNADALRKEMLKIVVDSIYSKKKRIALFLSPPPDVKHFQFQFDSHSQMAMAALDADKNVRRLRAGLVPGKMKEEMFWKVYFYHVRRIRQTLVANHGTMPEQPVEEEEDEDPASFFGEDGDDEELAAFDAPSKQTNDEPTSTAPDTNAKPSKTTESGNRDWDDEIDAIFDDNE